MKSPNMLLMALVGGLMSSSALFAGPATQAADSPKAAMKAYNAAMRAGDVDAIVAMYHATNDDENRVTRAVARSEAYVGKLMVSIQEKFGDDAVARVAAAMRDLTDNDIDAAAEQIDGDRATIQIGDVTVVTLVRVDGQWKTPASETLEHFGSVEQANDWYSRRGNFAKVLAQDISAGQFTTIEQVLDRVAKHRGDAGADEKAEMDN